MKKWFVVFLCALFVLCTAQALAEGTITTLPYSETIRDRGEWIITPKESGQFMIYTTGADGYQGELY